MNELIRAAASLVAGCTAVLISKAAWDVLRAGPARIRHLRTQETRP